MMTLAAPPSIYPWQTNLWQRLLQQQAQQRLPHALLLTGQAGLGKHVFADRWAQYLLCKEPLPTHSACGQCQDCHLWANSIHPDYCQLAAEEDSKVIKIEAIRELIQKLQTTRRRAAYQIAVIRHAEQLNTAAANALLKTLEEPVGATLLLLVTHQPGLLPATIISRCQALSFSASDHPAMLDWLDQALPQSEKSRSALWLKWASGSPLTAVALANSDYLALRHQLLTYLIDNSQQRGQVLAPVSDLLKKDLERIFEILSSLYHDLLRIHLGVDASQLIHSDCVPSLTTLSQYCTPQQLHQLLTELLATQYLLKRHAPLNQQQVIEQLLLSWELRHANVH